jgi:hypothetical protein
MTNPFYLDIGFTLEIAAIAKGFGVLVDPGTPGGIVAARWRRALVGARSARDPREPAVCLLAWFNQPTLLDLRAPIAPTISRWGWPARR